METNNQNTAQNTANTENKGENTNGQTGNQLNDLLGMATPYLGMLQDQAGRVPEMLQTAYGSVCNGYKNMSTTTKVVTASALAVGVGLLVNNMRKGNKTGSNGFNKKSGKNKA